VQAAARYDWHTVRGTREDAKALERKYENAKKNDEYIGRPERKTFEEVANLFLDDRRAKNRRVSTLEEYQTELKLRLLPQPNEKLPPLGPRNIRNIQRADMKVHFNSLRNRVCTISQVNKVIKAAKAIFATATPFELGLFGTLSISGPRPAKSMRWSGRRCISMSRSRTSALCGRGARKGFAFTRQKPKSVGAQCRSPRGSRLSCASIAPARAALGSSLHWPESARALRAVSDDATHPTRAPRASQRTSPSPAAARHRRRAARRQ